MLVHREAKFILVQALDQGAKAIALSGVLFDVRPILRHAGEDVHRFDACDAPVQSPRSRNTEMKAFAVDDFGTSGSVRDLPAPEPEVSSGRRVASAVGTCSTSRWRRVPEDQTDTDIPLVPGTTPRNRGRRARVSRAMPSCRRGVRALFGSRTWARALAQSSSPCREGTVTQSPSSRRYARRSPPRGHRAEHGRCSRSVAGADRDRRRRHWRRGELLRDRTGHAPRARSWRSAVARTRTTLESLGAVDVIDYEAGDVVDAILIALRGRHRCGGGHAR